MTTLSRLTVVLNPKQREQLESLAARRFGRRTSATFLYALELADLVLSHPATIRAETPEQALDTFVQASRGVAEQSKEEDRVPPR